MKDGKCPQCNSATVYSKLNGMSLGEVQVDKALKFAENPQGLVIGVVHHPLEWLYPFDWERVEHPIHQNCHLLLHGHEHKVEIKRQSSPGADVVILGNGPVYENNQERNCYFTVDLNMVTGRGTVKMMRYSPNDGGAWVVDTISKVHTSHPGEIDFEIMLAVTKNTSVI